ncbi:hypothetical protein F5Y04DRAFT_281188 [Hypomontagnella monticulosa]|nr:hypothetical protein F5Y04DRAFT_281188 [Hypomontagnella monticulosa]
MEGVQVLLRNQPKFSLLGDTDTEDTDYESTDIESVATESTDTEEIDPKKAKLTKTKAVKAKTTETEATKTKAKTTKDGKGPSSKSKRPMKKTSVEVLFTFNCLETQGPSPTENHPDIPPPPSQNAGNTFTQSEGSILFSAVSGPAFPPPQNSGLIGYQTSDDEDDQDKQDQDEDDQNEADQGESDQNEQSQGNVTTDTTENRFLAIPGHPPSIVEDIDIPDTKFKVRSIESTRRPEGYYDDLCRGAQEVGKSNVIQEASFVSDVETLGALATALRDKVTRRDVSLRERKKRGIIIAAHKVGSTIFLKVISPHATESLRDADSHVVACAMDQLKKKFLQRCPGVIADRNSKSLQELNAYKRVLSYRLGGLKIIVEDSNQAISTAHECNVLGVDDMNGPRYTVFRREQDIGSDGTRLYVRKLVKQADNKKDFGLMSQLWLSHSRTALIFQCSTHIEQEDDDTDAKIENEFEVFDSQVAKRKRKSSTSEATGRETGLDLWAAEDDNKEALRLLRRALRHIQDMSKIAAEAGFDKFALRQMRKESTTMTAEFTSYSAHLIMDLVSPKTIHDLHNVVQTQADKELDG